MKRPSRLSLLAAAVVACLSGAPARLAAQEDLQEADRLLAERFGRSADQLAFERSIRKILQNRESYGLSPQQIMKMFPEVVKRPGDFGIDPRDPQWRELLPHMQRPPQMPGGGIPPPIDPRNPVPMPPDGPIPMPPDGVNPVRPPPGGDPVRPPMNNLGGNRFRGGNFGGGMSGPLRNMVDDLVGGKSRLRDLARGLTLDVRSFTSKLLPRLDGIRLDRLAGGLRNLLPSNIGLPSLSGGGLPSVRGGIPSISMPSTGDMGSGMVIFAIVAGAVAVFVWLLWFAVRKWVPAELLARWRLGPWPVQPGAVSTRGELVQAFEYLALLNLGLSATASHHKDIANRLGARQRDTAAADRTEAAAELGNLYEQARYSPPDEQLSAGQLEAARHDLCLLAGVAAA